MRPVICSNNIELIIWMFNNLALGWSQIRGVVRVLFDVLLHGRAGPNTHPKRGADCTLGSGAGTFEAV